MLEYEKIEGIDANKSSSSRECSLCIFGILLIKV